MIFQPRPYLVDTNFIGTSSHGRTYAGTVRALDCAYLAQSRVADRLDNYKTGTGGNILRILGDYEIMQICTPTRFDLF